jgi:hypothetical protein
MSIERPNSRLQQTTHLPPWATLSLGSFNIIAQRRQLLFVQIRERSRNTPIIKPYFQKWLQRTPASMKNCNRFGLSDALDCTLGVPRSNLGRDTGYSEISLSPYMKMQGYHFDQITTPSFKILCPPTILLLGAVQPNLVAASWNKQLKREVISVHSCTQYITSLRCAGLQESV